ncbi:hypothetical protein [Zhihengliuella sp. ISTPL4]|uniref:hypothetical protein n=1 Tax=Zhihengliuella sp. ISTPL4 TaxID=2058657 RepID=UPI00256FD3E1|nr:hypothetical protein [Zhihengliuella sp. ISTPL4]
MTNTPPPPGTPESSQQPEYAAPAQTGYPTAQPPGPVETKQRNVLGIIALIVAAVGFIFACIPGALIVGWVLLPIGFILGLVSLFLKGKVKWQGIAAIIVSVVGTVVGVVVFTAVVATAFTDSFGGSDVEVGEPTSTSEEANTADEEEAPAAEQGTRENPLPLGTPLSADEWTVTINSVTLNAQDQLLAASDLYNEAPDAGTEYIIINYTIQYTGKDAEGGMPAFVGVDYVTADGNTVNPLDKMVMASDPIDLMSPLYEGASVSGNNAMQVPTPADGVLAVRPGMVADKVFVAIQ